MDAFKILYNKLITSRKAMVAFLVLVFSSLALWFGKLDGSNYRQLVEWVLGTYIVSQGGVDIATALASKTISTIESVAGRQ